MMQIVFSELVPAELSIITHFRSPANNSFIIRSRGVMHNNSVNALNTEQNIIRSILN